MFASLSAPGTINMGERNVVSSRNTLMEHSIPLVAQDVGADYGRTVRFRIADGRVDISSVAHGSRTL
jgi:chemotaxis protein CheD